MGTYRGWIRAAALCLAVGALASCATGGRVTYSGGTLEELTPEDEKRGHDLAVEGMRLLKGADSVRLAVHAGDGAKARNAVVHMDRDGNCKGTYDLGPAERGDLIVVADGAAYARYTDESLDALAAMGARRGPAAAAGIKQRTDLARGKYLKLPAAAGTSGAANPMKSCDLETLTSSMPTEPKADETFKALAETRRYGQDVVPVVGEQDGQRMTMYVATTGKPYVVAVRQVEHGETMTMRLSAYDEPVGAVAPPAERTLDLTRFAPEGGGGGSLFEV
ncbi:hypothetical protein ABZ953_03845 [Streptomyces sp. NPDC046465]|uniref:hypothetical protein n=1 Tax=Streptomyces sp. NPDC046465 TaxID=3155810 RepID=UPI003403DD02